jgi:hypothetical protein
MCRNKAPNERREKINFIFSDFLLGVERIFESEEGRKIIAISGKESLTHFRDRQH